MVLGTQYKVAVAVEDLFDLFSLEDMYFLKVWVNNSGPWRIEEANSRSKSIRVYPVAIERGVVCRRASYGDSMYLKASKLIQITKYDTNPGF